MAAGAAGRAEMRGRTEQRVSPRSQFELREVPNGTGGLNLKFSGYASVVERAYEMEDLFGPFDETITQGAFKRTIADGCDTAFLLNHEGMSLARTKSGTLKLSEDGTGLYSEAVLDPGNPVVAQMRSGVERGDLDEMSFAFRVVRDAWSKDFMHRRISEVSLDKGDVSLVNYGANPHTGGTVALRQKLGYRAPSVDDATVDSCNRCGGHGTIVLQGKHVKCPLCGGSGTGESNATNDGVASQGLSPIGLNAASPGTWRRLADLGASARRDEAALRAALELSATDSARDRLALERAKGGR